jgi:hypothetical protein
MTAYVRTTTAGTGLAYVRTTTGPTDSVAPTFSAGPSSSNIANTTFTISATPSKVSILALVVTSSGASQPADATFDASSFRKGYTASGTSGSINYTGATAGATYKAWIQLKDSDGNRTTSSVTLTTSAVAPNITGVSSNNPTFGTSLTITGLGFASSGNVVTLDGITQTITSESTTSIVITVNGRFGSVLSLVVTEPVNSLSSSYLITSITLPAGWSYVDIGTPNTTAASRITSTPDLVSGDQVMWGNVVGTGAITVNSDGTFISSSNLISAFDARIWSTGYGYGTAATQSIDITSPSGYSVVIDQASINVSNQSAISFTFTGAEVGSTYDYTFTSSTGGTPVNGTGTVTSSSQQITGINTTSLTDGTVTLSLVLTDTAGNPGSPATSVKNKDTSTGGTPNPFTFSSQANVGLSTIVLSNIVIISGITGPVSVQIINGEYSINGGAWASANTTLTNGATLQVRHVSSNSFSTTITTSITVGLTTETLQSTTVAQDTIPNSFSFTSVTGASLNTVYNSNAITVAGINSPSAISISGGTYSKNGAAYTSVAGTVASGDIIVVQVISSGTQSTLTSAVLTIGGVSGTYNVTTISPTSVQATVTLYDIVNNVNTISANTSYDWFIMTSWGTGLLGSGTTSTNSGGVLVTTPVNGSQGPGWLFLKKTSDSNYATVIPVTLS